MLQVHFIRENKAEVLAGLAKRNFANASEIIEQVLTADENRRSTQVELDNTLAESNKISKEIGNLYKTGQAQKANLLKEKTGQLKENSKELSEKLTGFADDTLEALMLPSIGKDLKVMEKANGETCYFAINQATGIRSYIAASDVETLSRV